MKNYSNKGKWYWAAASKEIKLFEYPSIAATSWEMKACVYCQEFGKYIFHTFKSLKKKLFIQVVDCEFSLTWSACHKKDTWWSSSKTTMVTYRAFWVELDFDHGFPCFGYTEGAQTHCCDVCKVFQ